MRRVLLVAVIGCGRLNFEPLSDASSLTSEADACAVTPWSAPTRLAGFDTADTEYGAALSPDGQLLVFTLEVTSPPATELWAARRSGPASFEAPSPIAALNSATEYGAAWNGTGDQLYFDSTRTGVDRLFVASYGNGVFGTPVLVNEFAGVAVRSPAIPADNLEMFYTDLNALATGRAVRPSPTAPWQLTGLVSELGDGQYASISADGLTIYFDSDRTGNREIYKATRSSRGAPFGASSLVTELSDPAAYDCDVNISFDDQLLIFCSTRPSATGQDDLFVSTRTCM